MLKTSFGPALAVALLLAANLPAEITVEKSEQGAVVKVDGKPFTEYVTQSNTKPILFPVIGPTGKAMTRSYPMVKEPVEGERQDHPHHRSFWFTHGDVNGIDFWDENPKRSPGKTVHRKFLALEGGKTGRIVTQNDWLSADGKKICEDERTLTFGADAERRWIDFDITIKATAGDVKFGDTKEGTFGGRVAGTMKVDSEPGGHIINSEGDRDKDAWGKQAAWCDFYGPVEGEQLGVAILNHPASFRFPTYWHSRTYGLFTANPFGLHHFKGDNDLDGSHTIPSGGNMTLNYRVLFHKGDEKEGKVAEEFAAYGKVPKGSEVAKGK